MALRRLMLMVAAVVLSCASVAAEKGEGDAQPSPPEFGPALDLRALLETVTKQTGKRFLVASRVPKQVSVGPLRLEDVTYPVLLAVLRNNGLAAVPSQGLVSIVQVGYVRDYPLLTVQEDNPEIAEDEWVTRVIQLKHFDAQSWPHQFGQPGK